MVHPYVHLLLTSWITVMKKTQIYERDFTPNSASKNKRLKIVVEEYAKHAKVGTQCTRDLAKPSKLQHTSHMNASKTFILQYFMLGVTKCPYSLNPVLDSRM